jgi:hypothetical protein
VIRELELPKHGLQILPLESTITPLDNGDYLGAWADPDETRRELCRHSHARRRRDGGVRPAHAAHGDGGEADPQHGAARSGIAGAFGLRGLLELGGHFRSLGASAFTRSTS